MNRRHFLSYALLSSINVLESKNLTIKTWHLGKYGEFFFENIHKNIYIMHGVNSAPDAINRGFINNPAFIEAKRGLIVIDPGGSYAIGVEVLKQIKRVSAKPIIAIFNTHSHSDHFFANTALKEVYPKAIIYAHKQMQASANELYSGDYAQRGFSFEKNTHVPFAEVKLHDKEHLHIDSEQFYIQHPKKAHTNNDISISHLNSNTIFMGDLLLENSLANFGLHSSICGNIEFLETINSQNEYSLYVPGHGHSGDKKICFTPYFTFMSIIKKEVQKAYDNELSMAELEPIKEAIILKLSWEDNLNFSYAFISRYMYHIYNELDTKSFV